MPGRDRKHWFGDLLVFMLPLVFVKVAGVMFNVTAPAGADAANAKAAEDIFQFQPEMLVERQSSTGNASSPAAEYAAQLRERSFGPSPMWYDLRRAKPKVEKTPEPEPQHEESIADLRVNMIMTARTGDIALINNDPYRVGDVVNATQWTVTTINGAERSVTVKHQETGRVEVIHVHNPDR